MMMSGRQYSLDSRIDVAEAVQQSVQAGDSQQHNQCSAHREKENSKLETVPRFLVIGSESTKDVS